jgi:glycosyltransferase involved in cell wall biosynthesis/O-antigen/teichoic acid export membrane protein
MAVQRRHILVLTDRDWTHPQGGGTGTHLFGLVSRWLAWGYRVTVVSAGYDGAEPVARPAEGLELHHLGSRLTVFARAARAVRGGLGADADVVLETVNGIAFFTPLWRLRRPRVAFVHHVHRDMYVEELGRRGAIAAWLLETLPLRHLYGGTPFVTVSESARAALVELGIEPERVSVVHNGVEAETFAPGVRSVEPSLLYLGRLKRYKRLEILLDVVAALPGVRLEIAGDGDHRAALASEIAGRGLGDRVTLHGHVSEERKRELLASAWLNLTASSAEGWCLAVIEAAASGTPSAALAVGGLTESIVDGETGVLARNPAGLADAVRELLADGERRERLGAAALRRAQGFTWERSATGVLDVLERVEAPEPLRATVRRRMSGPAGVAAATLAAGAGSLMLTMVLARALGAGGFGALAALTSLLLILAVPGAAVQLAMAREVAAGGLGESAGVAATLRRWRRLALAGALGAAAVAALAREPLAALAGVDDAWAAAALVPAAVLWMAVFLHRGALQGAGVHGAVSRSLLAEAAVRVAVAVALVAAGLGVAGAVLGTVAAMLAALAVLARRARALGDAGAPARAGLLRARLRRARLPVAGLTLLAAIGQVDVVVAQHRLGAAAGPYAAAAVASKVVVWVSAGLALALLPELSRQVRAGAAGRARLVRTLVLVLAFAAPLALACVLAAGPLLRVVFGPDLDGAADALPWLAVAMSLFACAFVAVQHSLALGGRRLLGVLAVVALAEPVALVLAGPQPVDVAGAVAALQLVLAAVVIGLGALAAAPRGGAEPA